MKLHYLVYQLAESMDNTHRDESSLGNASVIERSSIGDLDFRGLDCRIVPCEGTQRVHDVELPVSYLLLQRSAGREMQVTFGGHSCRFKVAVDRFDYYPARHYDAITCGVAPAEALVVQIPVSFEDSVLAESDHFTGRLPRFQFHDRRLESLVKSLLSLSESASASVEAVLVSAAVVDRLHEVLSGVHGSTGSLSFSRIIKRLVVEYLDLHLSAPRDISQIGFLTGLARTQADKAFRNSFGLPFHQYIVNRRIEVACRILSASDLTVTELAYRLGFSSHAHFTSTFRKHMALTPSQYRIEARATQRAPMGAAPSPKNLYESGSLR